MDAIAPRKRVHSHIDMAPLVDVVFLLLVFFVLAFKLFLDPVIEVSLPGARSALPQEDEAAVITLHKDGAIYLGPEQMDSLDQLGARLRAEPDSEQSLQAVAIRADKEASVDLLIQVMDCLRLNNRPNCALITETNPKQDLSSGQSEGKP